MLIKSDSTRYLQVRKGMVWGVISVISCPEKKSTTPCMYRQVDLGSATISQHEYSASFGILHEYSASFGIHTCTTLSMIHSQSHFALRKLRPISRGAAVFATFHLFLVSSEKIQVVKNTASSSFGFAVTSIASSRYNFI